MAEAKKYQIRIESILGGQSPLSHFSRSDQYRAALGIDPALPLSDFMLTTAPASGLLRPVGVLDSTVSLGAKPVWIKNSPKTTSAFIYDINGSAHTRFLSTYNGALSDGGSLSSSSGNGCEYYDNYQYFAKNTDIARYGPLNGDAVFDGTYWTGTLSKPALTNTAYPTEQYSSTQYPNHVMHRHSDGKLYFADVVGNQGTIHVISTTKTSVEGDTNNGSTANALQFGYGLWPTAIESYGTNLAIALYEGTPSGAGMKTSSAKLAFWDTTSANFNSIIFVEFPDQIITALKNVNGVLYIASGNEFGSGFRVSRYVGGTTVEEVGYFEHGQPPFAGAVDGTSNRLLFGSNTLFPTSPARGCVYSYGLQKGSMGNGLFISMVSSTTQGNSVYSLLIDKRDLSFSTPTIGWSTGSGQGAISIVASNNYSTANQLFQTQLYKIGQPFKITKITIPFPQAIAANMVVTPKIYTDDGNGQTYTGGTTNGLSIINNTNYSGKTSVTMRPENATGNSNFYLELSWTGSVLCTVGLPIIIEYELLNIDP